MCIHTVCSTWDQPKYSTREHSAPLRSELDASSFLCWQQSSTTSTDSTSTICSFPNSTEWIPNYKRKNVLFFPFWQQLWDKINWFGRPATQQRFQHSAAAARFLIRVSLRTKDAVQAPHRMFSLCVYVFLVHTLAPICTSFGGKDSARMERGDVLRLLLVLLRVLSFVLPVMLWAYWRSTGNLSIFFSNVLTHFFSQLETISGGWQSRTIKFRLIWKLVTNRKFTTCRKTWKANISLTRIRNWIRCAERARHWNRKFLLYRKLWRRRVMRWKKWSANLSKNWLLNLPRWVNSLLLWKLFLKCFQDAPSQRNQRSQWS